LSDFAKFGNIGFASMDWFWKAIQLSLSLPWLANLPDQHVFVIQPCATAAAAKQKAVCFADVTLFIYLLFILF